MARQFCALSLHPVLQIGQNRGAQFLAYPSRRSADAPLISRSMSNRTSIRFTASSAIGEIGVAFLPRRLLDAMSASSKNLRLEWLQQAASVTRPGT